GHEASFTDTVTLTYNGSTIFNNQSSSSGAVVLANATLFPVQPPPGPVPFKFTVNGGLSAINGGAIGGGLQIGIHLVSNVVAYVFLDDGGGAGIHPDADFDDAIFRVAVTCGPDGQECAPFRTPLPAALPLFASGLGGLGFLGWRRKRKAAKATA